MSIGWFGFRLLNGLRVLGCFLSSTTGVNSLFGFLGINLSYPLTATKKKYIIIITTWMKKPMVPVRQLQYMDQEGCSVVILYTVDDVTSREDLHRCQK